MAPTSSQTTLRLTALWALSESALGGMMHAMKMPFTGLFLGGFAVVVVTLLAYHSSNRWRTVIGATLLVISIKFLASPHTPFTAYIAVGFQGFIGAIIYSWLPFYKISAALFGMLALAESAVQRLLMMTLIYGESIWTAINVFYKNVAREFQFSPDHSLSAVLMVSYVSIYLLVGLVVGYWSFVLCTQLQTHAAYIIPQYQQLKANVPLSSVRKKKNKLIPVIFILLFIISVFVFQGWNHDALYAVMRTIAALLLLFYVVNPMVLWLIKKYSAGKSDQISPVLQLLPELRNYVEPAMQMAKSHSKGWAVYPAFVRYLLVLSLYNSTRHEE